MAKFLDENGVQKLWSRIQEYVYECCCSKGGGGLVLRVASTEQATTKECANGGTKYIFDHTYQEVVDAAQSGRTVTAIRETDGDFEVFYFMSVKHERLLAFFGRLGNLVLIRNAEEQLFFLECEDDGGEEM